jgi:hypothetical protein
VQHVKIYKKVPTFENVQQLCEELFLLKFIFFVDSLLLVTQIIKGKQLYYKMWSSKSYILRIIDHLCFFATYIKGGTPAQICLERGSAMTRATFFIFWPKLSSFIDWCYYTQVSYTGSWEPLVCNLQSWARIKYWKGVR